MILFYSVHCKHCSMLLDSVRRFDTNGAVKLMNIETLRHTHPNVYKQLQAVPALMTLPSKEIIYGKAVFDYLLLPTRGKLVSAIGQPTNDVKIDGQPKENAVGILHIEEGVMAFNGISKSRGLYSDSFADIHETQSTPSDPSNNPHSSFNWISIDEMMRLGSSDASSSDGGGTQGMKAGLSSSQVAIATNNGMGLETRATKETIDVDSIRRERDKDLQSLYAGQTMPI